MTAKPKSGPSTSTAGRAKARGSAAGRKPTKTGGAKRPVKARRGGKAKGASRAKRTASPRPGRAVVGPSEASYSSVLFRSRTEARWAVFFDLMGWSWDYEPCHYGLGTLNYLPDFYLPDTDVWVEVKGPSFLDAASMGKVASAAAGPHPLPSRRPPYGPASAVVLVGPMSPAGRRPVHQLVAPTGEARVAGFTRAVWEVEGTVRPLDDRPWLKVPATGAKTTRRPSPVRTSEILEPAPVGTVGMAGELQRAFAVAGSVRFDDTTGRLARTTSAGLLAELALRRAGRPLGCAA